MEPDRTKTTTEELIGWLEGKSHTNYPERDRTIRDAIIARLRENGNPQKIKDRSYGPNVAGGRLFFKLLDGSNVSCNCIADPYISQIVEACRVKSDGWLIELKESVFGSPYWWGGGIFPDEVHDDFTKDSLKAIRFARKEDAEAIIQEFGWTEAFASEHQWGP